jgi:hypothetical protein
MLVNRYLIKQRRYIKLPNLVKNNRICGDILNITSKLLGGLFLAFWSFVKASDSKEALQCQNLAITEK